MKLLLRLAALVVVLGVAVTGVLAYTYQSFLDRPLDIDGDRFVYSIESGASFSRVARELESLGPLSDARWFRLHGRLTGLASRVQAGEYDIEAGTTPRELLKKFTTGDVRLYAFTIIEGWNRWELLDFLAASDVVVSTLSDEDWPALLAELGAETSNPEGLFLPETYLFPRGTTDRELLTDAYRAMQAVLDEEWQARSAVTMAQTPYEALVLASIIEKETGRADERDRISGVFTRRMQKRMRLQTDPTVIYGLMPDFNGNLTRRDLRTDTPYNTYTRRGLPPTPIAMPGQAAIHAALHPADGVELFFVATGLADGSHTFSETKEQHDAAVQVYLQRLRQRREDGAHP